MQSLRWTSPRPFGPGTTREVVLRLRAIALREEPMTLAAPLCRLAFGQVLRGARQYFAKNP